MEVDTTQSQAIANHPITEFIKHPLSRFDAGILLLILIIALFARLVPQPRLVDDAFITFRYSRNVINGDGFVYNRDSRVLGTTTPLYTLLMASISGVFGEDFPWYALIVNAIADMLSVGLLFLIGGYLTQYRKAGLLVGAMWAIAPFSVTFAIGGMETSVHNLWMIAAWAAYLDRCKGGWIGAFVALGLLTRPDALLWAAPLMLHQLWTRWNEHFTQLSFKLPWRDYVAGLIIGLPWIVFATIYFGSPIPHTVGTKSTVYLVPSTQAIVRLLQHYATPIHQHEIIGASAGVAIGLFLFPTLALIGLRDVTSRISVALPILTYPWLYFIVFSYLNPLIFRWYLTPPLPAYLLAIISGMVALFVAFERYLGTQRLRFSAGAFAAVVLLSMASGWTINPDHGPNSPAPKMAFHDLELNYERMARRLVEEQHVTEDTLIAAGDIGVIGFYTDATILDTVGLVTKGLDHFYDPEIKDEIVVDGANYAIPPEMILEYKPEYIVAMYDSFREGLLKNPHFAELYGTEPLYRIETDYYGGEMLVYKRQTVEVE